MTTINLVPFDRLERIAELRCLRRWVILVGGLGVLFVSALVGIPLFLGGGVFDYGSEIGRLSVRIEHSSWTIGGLAEQIQHQERMLGAVRRIGAQPNWGVPLAFLASRGDDDIMLTACSVRGEGAADESVGDPAAYAMQITGYGPSRAIVLDYVLGLERSELFDDVSLASSRQVPFNGHELTAFTIDASLDGRGRPR